MNYDNTFNFKLVLFIFHIKSCIIKNNPQQLPRKESQGLQINSKVMKSSAIYKIINIITDNGKGIRTSLVRLV